MSALSVHNTMNCAIIKRQMHCILDGINSPRDVKALSSADVKKLCDELRETMINMVSTTGGHLASSLGAIEITVALHRVFDSPRDKILWDVGHQSYAHKLLTGRREQFNTLRQYGGLSGFPNPEESPHDAFVAGHGGNSISAALGMALARDLANEDYRVVAVIGDGCLTCGMAYEAFNHAGHLGTKLIVVLNDNGMSISPTVGAIAKRLNLLRTGHRYKRAKAQTNQLLTTIPGGDKMEWLLHRATEGAKAIFMPTMIWEQLGFTYLGPVNGHSVEDMEETLAQARRCDEPVVVHALTTKGKGYAPAEDDPVRFHGISPTHVVSQTAPTYSEVFARTAGRLLRENSRVVVITAAMIEGNSLSALAKEFPQRVYDVGISEQHAVTLAAGLASQGFTPIVAIYSTFLQRAFDQLIHDICLPDLPVIFAMDRSGIVGEDGKTHQGLFDLSYLGLIPNIIVAAPGNENELQQLLYTALEAGHPMAIRYPRGWGAGTTLDADFSRIPIGKGEIVREGKDVVIMAIGATVTPSMEAADLLAASGVDAMVVNARFVRPLDEDLILRVSSSVGKVLTVEDNVLNGGFGASVLGVLEKSRVIGIKSRRLGIPNEFVTHGSQDYLRSLYHLDARGIARECADFLVDIQPEMQRKFSTAIFDY
jgi:1-deoxy-D-xylulose-5-phosphate synthase